MDHRSQKDPKRGDTPPPRQKQSAWQNQINRDMAMWERSRLQTMGPSDTFGLSGPYNPSEDPDHKSTGVHLVVKDADAPFMLQEGSPFAPFAANIPGARIKNSSSRPSDTRTATSSITSPFKDSGSDMALVAKRGSAVVALLRERREHARQMKSFAAPAAEPVDEDTPVFSTPSSIQARHQILNQEDIKRQRRSLPAFAVRDQLLRLISENQVMVVVGETGSGKTTQLTQYLYEAGFSKSSAIGCTQPRRVAAMSVAKRVSHEMGCALGSIVGYAIRFEDLTSFETRIKYMTDGVLLRECLRDPDLDAYSVVILDEAHERSLQTDVLLGLLRGILSRRRDLRVIVTSATMRAERFSEYFGGAPVFTIPGRTFPVEVIWSKAPQEDYVDAAVRQALQIHMSHPVGRADQSVPSGDILIFMTGQEDIQATCDLLSERLAVVQDRPGVAPMLILPIYSQLPPEAQGRIFEAAPLGYRKCIVATNIAETSLTLDGVTFVVDSGYAKIKVYNPRIGMDALQIAPISQAAAQQRSGRAGRTSPGIAYRLYTETAFNTEMYAANIPEIQRTNLANVVLLLKSLGVNSVLDFCFLDGPPVENTVNSMYGLWALGALDDTGKLTGDGLAMVELPVDPSLSRMILSAVSEPDIACLEQILILVGMLSVPGIWFRPKERQADADAARERFTIPESDHLTLINVFDQWTRHGNSESWSTANFLNGKALRKAREVRDQLAEILPKLTPKHKMVLSKASSSRCDFNNAGWIDPVKKCIASCSVMKAARMRAIGEYVNLRTGMPCFLHPSSALSGLGYCPEYVVYHELVLTSKEYMQCVTAVDPAWLVEAAPLFYTIRNANVKLTTFKNLKSTYQSSPEIDTKGDSLNVGKTVSNNQLKKPSNKKVLFGSGKK